MAGVKGRSGGDRPRDPFAISATGGAGSKNGQPKRYIPTGKFGESKKLMDQQSGAAMAQGTPPAQPSSAAQGEPFVRRAGVERTLLDPKPGTIGPISDGVDFGRGRGSEVLPKNISGETRPVDNMAIVKKYFPAMLRASQIPNTPDSYKRFISYLSGQIGG